VVGMVCGYLPSLHHVTTRKLRDYDEDHISAEEVMTKPEPQTMETPTLTWEAYVDEMYHQYNVERSA
jgi:hypothetical protein